LQLYGRAWGCFQDIAQLEHQLNSSGVVMVVQEHRFELFGDHAPAFSLWRTTNWRRAARAH
jgi:predicted N-acyltransferase